MAGEFVAFLKPDDFQRETDLGNDQSVALVLGPGEASQGTPGADIRGLSLPKYKTSGQGAYGYTSIFRIPPNITMGTGLTFNAYLTDDGKNSLDLGKKINIGITLKRLASGATDDIDVSAATEQTVATTLSANSAGVGIGTLAVANASLPSGTVVGDLVMVRVRRKATDGVNDTAPGRALLLGVAVNNT